MAAGTESAPSAKNSQPLRVFRFALPVAATRAGYVSASGLVDRVGREAGGAERLRAARQRVATALPVSARPTLADLRRAAGLSQKELAEMCGIEQSHVSRYESGRVSPSLDAAEELAAALRTTLDGFAQARKNTLSSLGAAA